MLIFPDNKVLLSAIALAIDVLNVGNTLATRVLSTPFLGLNSVAHRIHFLFLLTIIHIILLTST